MGGSSSKDKQRIRQLEEQQIEMQRKHEAMLKRLTEQRAEAQRQNQATFEEVAKLMLLFALARNGETTTTKGDKKEIEIEGATYQLIEFIDRGGFGEVHKAKAKNKDQLVAIKIMKNTKAITEEVKNEINFLLLTKQIPIKNHPVILCYGTKTTPENIFIAMELAAVDLLHFWVQQAEKGDNENLVTMGMIIIIYTLRALTFLEQLNIIHGDIKPQNIVIVPNGDAFCVKLIDFGTVEKMMTVRHDITVDATKAYTCFFAAPEFCKQNAGGTGSKRLHKKSDAWAAGVMFYLLFCGELPWKDPHEYQRFCNDSRAKDIVVPEIGGFKMIIELLLKKDPEERASAKGSLMQLKAHPTFGKVIEALHNNFCPVDDVCNMRVPDNVRDGLVRMGRSSVPRPMPEHTTGKRRSCRFGRGCYRKDAVHRQEFAHPGDSDYSDSPSAMGSERPACRYGTSCYRKDTDHRQKFDHTSGSGKIPCKFGADCNKKDQEHLRKYTHVPDRAARRHGDDDDDDDDDGDKREKCRFGPACTKRNDPQHMKTYRHDSL